jgi:hypothetical protein
MADRSVYAVTRASRVKKCVTVLGGLMCCPPPLRSPHLLPSPTSSWPLDSSNTSITYIH